MTWADAVRKATRAVLGPAGWTAQALPWGAQEVITPAVMVSFRESGEWLYFLNANSDGLFGGREPRPLLAAQVRAELEMWAPRVAMLARGMAAQLDLF